MTGKSIATLSEWLRDNAPDCGDNSCLFGGRGKGGMRTNGGCRCFKDLPAGKRIFVERLFSDYSTPSATKQSAPSSIARGSYMPGLKLAQDMLRKNGFEKSAKAVGVQIAHLEAQPSLDCPPRMVNVPSDLWNEIVQFIMDREDIRDGSDGKPLPNDAMVLGLKIKEAYVGPR